MSHESIKMNKNTHTQEFQLCMQLDGGFSHQKSSSVSGMSVMLLWTGFSLSTSANPPPPPKHHYTKYPYSSTTIRGLCDGLNQPVYFQKLDRQLGSNSDPAFGRTWGGEVHLQHTYTCGPMQNRISRHFENDPTTLKIPALNGFSLRYLHFGFIDGEN